MGRANREDYLVDSIYSVVLLWLLLLVEVVVCGIKYIYIYWVCIDSDSIFIIVQGISRILYKVIIVSLSVLIKLYCHVFHYTVYTY